MPENFEPADSSTASTQTNLSYFDLGRLGHSAWWRYLIGAVLVFGVFIISSVFWYVVIILVASHGKMPDIDLKTGQFTGIDPMVNYLAINIPSWVLCLSTLLVVRFLHDRPILSLITTAKQPSWKRLGFGLIAWLCLAAVSGIVGWVIFPHAYKYEAPGAEYFSYLPVVLFFTPMQCLAEELFFRGYLLQAMGKLVRNIWFASAVNGLLFAVPHLCNPEVSYGIIPMFLCYFSIGFLLALITLRTNGLEMAIGLHIANNLFNGLILNDEKSVLTTKSIFMCTNAHPWYEFSAVVVTGAILYLTIDRYLSKRSVQV